MPAEYFVECKCRMHLQNFCFINYSAKVFHENCDTPLKNSASINSAGSLALNFNLFVAFNYVFNFYVVEVFDI